MEEDEILIKSGVFGQAARPNRGLFVAAIWPRFGRLLAACLTAGKVRRCGCAILKMVDDRRRVWLGVFPMIDGKTIDDTAQRIAREFAPEKIILFGSYARGDFHDESDIDIMPVINGTSMNDLMRDELFDITYPYMLNDQIKVSAIPTLASHYERAETFLLMFVHKDGIEL